MNHIKKTTIDWFFSRGYQLVPLTRPDDLSIPVKARGKKPLNREWQKRTYDVNELIKLAPTHNLGCRLDTLDFVVDVDPRNGGTAGLEALEEFLGLGKLSKLYPTVITGSGGFHVYMKIPFDAYLEAGGKFRENDKGFLGLEFKNGKGRQLVIPGSFHAEMGEHYKWDELSPYRSTEPIPEVPAELLERLTLMHTPAVDPGLTAPISPEELGEILELLDVTEYSTNDVWFPMLTACYNITLGQGIDQFLEWSTSDPQFAHAGHQIQARWRSFRAPNPTEQTRGYFLRELRSRGIAPPKYLLPDTRENYAAEPLPGAGVLADLAGEPINLSTVRSMIEEIIPGEPLETVLRAVAVQAPLDQADLLVSLAKHVGVEPWTIRIALRAVIRDMERQAGAKPKKPLIVPEIATLILHRGYEGGKSLVHALDQKFWEYDGVKWTRVYPNLLDQKIHKACLEYQNATGVAFDTTVIVPKVSRALQLEIAEPVDFYSDEIAMRPVINCENCEIWVNPDGTADVKNHTPESFLSHSIPIRFDPEAACPTFDRMLEGIFLKLPDAPEVIELIWELFGYAIQPLKNIPSWWLFHGSGCDGKSALLKVLGALLGPGSALYTKLGGFSKGKDNHIMTQLIGKLALIDDDLELNTVLPDNFLKTASENAPLVANPKGEPAFTFITCASIIIASNHWPPTRDSSRGMRRRAHIIPFNRSFAAAEEDRTIAQRVIQSELPGVLNKALAGLRRLRTRDTGDFRRNREGFDSPTLPESCESAYSTWVTSSNQVTRFLDDACIVGGLSKIESRALWGAFRVWAHDAGIRHGITRHAFYGTLDDLGYPRVRGAGNRYYTRGVKLLVDND